eukprot:CAMPEP_0171540118 /NCGR_PEP_ID=MMETSP0960-20121227/1005_1 /TAXON_ID=87120 /ORGANISM="Aurantiochytrium limacinum, Strain ATCCMYA-1381" /LENGTH=327 /DNA_ID=CAMNT_0012087255 /DNA_START=65 /DNA_END=1048 /DNA_ORIENTATION=-
MEIEDLVRGRLLHVLEESGWDERHSTEAVQGMVWQDIEHRSDQADQGSFVLPLSLCAALLLNTTILLVRLALSLPCRLKSMESMRRILTFRTLACTWAQKPALSALLKKFEAWNESGIAPRRLEHTMSVPGVVEVGYPETLEAAKHADGTDGPAPALLAYQLILACEEAFGSDVSNARVDKFLETLGVNGVLYCLDHRVTTGTLPVLSPPLDVLLSSFLLPNRPTKPLTVGGRALTKHCNRGAADWWGGDKGNDGAKNVRAYNRVIHILKSASWVNIHVLPAGDKRSLLPVIEFRCPEGFGARWSADGISFRGFLEPIAHFQLDRGT